MPRMGGAVVGDPTGVGELPVGVAEGRAVCDGLGDRVGEGEVRVDAGADADAVGEALAVEWVAPADSAGVTGRTRK
ncbi:MAG TPA: hypothetical protein VGD83_03670 [Streptosporangiaceae bacterium]